MCPSIKPNVSPQYAFSRLEVFWSRLKAGEVEGAKPDWAALASYAAETLALGSYPHECHYALGLAFQYAGDNDKADAQYRAAIGPGADSANATSLKDAAYAASSAESRNCTRPVHPLLCRWDAGDFAVLRRGQFVIYHHNAELAERAARALEYYMSLDVLDGFLPKNAAFSCDCDVTIYRSHEEFLDATGEPAQAMGCFRAATSNGKATMLEIHVFEGAPAMLGTTLRHELGHVRLAMIPGFHMGLPPWIQEGVASAAERPERAAEYHRALADALAAGTLPPLAQTLDADHVIAENSYALGYAQSLACVEALVRRGGPDRFTKFIEVTGAKGPDEGLAKVYGMTTADLEALLRGDIKSYSGNPQADKSTPAASADIAVDSSSNEGR
jgi:hypothetical protein